MNADTAIGGHGFSVIPQSEPADEDDDRLATSPCRQNHRNADDLDTAFIGGLHGAIRAPTTENRSLQSAATVAVHNDVRNDRVPI